jgi:hypothetical protein
MTSTIPIFINHVGLYACMSVNTTPWQPNTKCKENFSPEYEVKIAKCGSGTSFFFYCHPSTKWDSKQYSFHVRHELGPIKPSRRSESIINVKRLLAYKNLRNDSNENIKQPQKHKKHESLFLIKTKQCLYTGVTENYSNQSHLMKEFDWIESDLRNSRRVGRKDSPATRSHPNSSEPVTKSRNL